MKPLKEKDMLDTVGGSRASAIIGGITCVLTLSTGLLGAIIFGPTCGGMILATFID